MFLLFGTVYRVSWLRAKARFDRWDEELLWVRNEMLWTLLWYKHAREAWENRAARADEEGKMGHAAYAWKQAELWKEFGVVGMDQFKGLMMEGSVEKLSS